ncbi:MAG: hypothetical protein OXI03_06375 [Chloroflexota bacterium]|nr:hypothetical protein [Chloroflexota bacterium]MYA36655.1 hypothetical protein [Gammaproteobacteria bacterium]
MSGENDAGRYVSGGQQTLIAVVEALAARPLNPPDLAQVAAAVGRSRDQTYRSLKNLDRGGWAEQTPGGGWRLTPRVTQLAERFRLALADTYRLYLHPEA